MSLSDKRFEARDITDNHILLVCEAEDVKDFIKKLKEDILKTRSNVICGGCEYEAIEIINKRAGKELI